jgi:hypothetical protein
VSDFNLTITGFYPVGITRFLDLAAIIAGVQNVQSFGGHSITNLNNWFSAQTFLVY